MDPDPGRASSQRALDGAAVASVPAVLIGAGVIFLAFCAPDLLFYPEPARVPLFLANLASGVALVAAGLAARRRPVAPGLAHPLMGAAAGAILANVLFGVVLGVHAPDSLYFVLVVMGTGAVFLSWRWNLAVAAATVLAWIVGAWGVPFDWARTQYALGLASAGAASALVCGVRIRLFAQTQSLRERLDALATRAPIVLFTLDREGRFTFAAGQGLGAPAESLVGRSVFEAFALTEDVSGQVARALAGETFTATLHDERRAFLVSYGPIRRGHGEVSGVVGVATDVTEQARAQRELEASRKHMARQERLAAIGTLVAGVAHEINNPLAFVRGNTQVVHDVLRLLEESPHLDEAERRDVRDAIGLVGGTLEGIDRLAHISESLRNVARSGNGHRALEDVNMVARMSLTVARPRLGKQLCVEESLDAGRAVAADRGEIGQVVLNLLLNAGDELAGREDGRVVLRSFDEGDKVVLEVEDNGRGVDPSKADLIFAPFVTTKANGTGLGLSISHRIVHDHGGVLSFRSRPGCTVFRMELPAARSEPPVPAEAAPVAGARVGSLPV